MRFDLSIFPKMGKWLFDNAIKLYKALDFDFGGFVLNGWLLLVGLAIIGIIIWFIGRISE